MANNSHGGGDMRESRIISTEPEALSSAQLHDHQQQSSSKKSSSSLPVNIPDWSRILRSDYYYYKQQQRRNDDDEEEENNNSNNGIIRVPPHELVAKQQMARNGNGTASFSVHEGVGRTLKGRDMSRVRNAIWEITAAFQD
ncbi:unnamed protein product [Rhodiola kirilowii]